MRRESFDDEEGELDIEEDEHEETDERVLSIARREPREQGKTWNSGSLRNRAGSKVESELDGHDEEGQSEEDEDREDEEEDEEKNLHSAHVKEVQTKTLARGKLCCFRERRTGSRWGRRELHVERERKTEGERAMRAEREGSDKQ